eukprot:CAMPEP_0114586272 /NCGR_PEP_ID=MMETSP0125-20121206/9548_1 /TAXON_ID=485358 ORGANISM="Aristerostoma sp., Strain ATCC 50986" /NCGR_SAMPLE_ID=MMETSP0125 /ASSEMBLY_ACC=CAM_ASM_000245 /LENGTH=348 /DNA_ID=CAMNT_0001781649 /DNA_START=89 /DNA_END=1135 /DNA_ORIENTATION=-
MSTLNLTQSIAQKAFDTLGAEKKNELAFEHHTTDSAESKNDNDSSFSSEDEHKVVKKVKTSTEKYASNPCLANLVKTLQTGFKELVKINSDVDGDQKSCDSSRTKPLSSVDTVSSTPNRESHFFKQEMIKNLAEVHLNLLDCKKTKNAIFDSDSEEGSEEPSMTPKQLERAMIEGREFESPKSAKKSKNQLKIERKFLDQSGATEGKKPLGLPFSVPKVKKTASQTSSKDDCCSSSSGKSLEELRKIRPSLKPKKTEDDESNDFKTMKLKSDGSRIPENYYFTPMHLLPQDEFKLEKNLNIFMKDNSEKSTPMSNLDKHKALLLVQKIQAEISQLDSEMKQLVGTLKF